MTLHFSNWTGGAIAAPVTASQTTNIQLATGSLDGAPAVPFIAVLCSPDVDSNLFKRTRESILVTAYTGDLIETCVRAYEEDLNGGTARDWTTNDSCVNLLTAKMFEEVLSVEEVTQSEAEAGVSTLKRWWSALRVRQAIIAYVTSGADVTVNANGVAITLPDFLQNYIFQFGASTFAIDTGESAGGNHNQTMPITFPSEFIAAIPSYKRIGIVGGAVGCYCSIVDNSTLNITVDPSIVAEPSPATVYWLAIGN